MDGSFCINRNLCNIGMALAMHGKQNMIKMTSHFTFMLVLKKRPRKTHINTQWAGGRRIAHPLEINQQLYII